MPDRRSPNVLPPSPGGSGRLERAGAAGTPTADGLAAALERADALSRAVLDLWSGFEPERASAVGVPGAADRISELPPRWQDRRAEAYGDAVRFLGRQLEAEPHPRARLEIEALLTALGSEIELLQVEAALLLPYCDPAQICFEGMRSLLSDPGAVAGAQARRRLRLYAGLEGGAPPLAEQIEIAVRAALGERGRVGPIRAVVERDLAQAAQLLAGIRRWLEELAVPGCEEACELLRRQLAAYARFARAEILPRCRHDFRQPSELYAAGLRAHGVDMPEDELASRARVAFRETRRQLAEDARRLARRRGWSCDGVRGVLNRLAGARTADAQTADARTTAARIVLCLRARLRDLEDLIARIDLVTLPRQRLRIRSATAAEARVMPCPHFRWPRLFGERCHLGDFIVPVAGGRRPDLVFETSAAASWLLLAHEAFPGHALQLGHLLELPSPARSILAVQPALREGWAVYAESEIRPYLPAEARVVAGRDHLRRAAAAFLDPGLQRGVFTPEQARHLLRARVGLSEASAAREIWRYTTWRPGYFTAYFCGYTRLVDLRAEAQCRSDVAFDRCRYHDRLLAEGFLPLPLLARRVLEEVSPQRRVAA